MFLIKLSFFFCWNISILFSLCDIRVSASVCVCINMHVQRYMHVPGYMGAGLFMFIATVCRFVA